MSQIDVKARENGPYIIRGQARYIDVDGVEHETSGRTVALCRCGGSKSKPFCDGTHRKIEYQAPEVVLTFESEE